ncbi:MAG: right-handed parallel beta-helix repeat-containing protein, partial [Planctomycetota bacterium]|nr:right-handed parallel beta-helix repeat-containing protein [Planctomycetota bacterium]
YWWLESGSSNNVEVSGNVITDCGGTGIAVVAEGARGKLSPAGSHSRIVVSGNTFSGCPMPNICVTSTDDVRIEGNALKSPTSTKRPPFGLDPAKIAPVMTENCTNAVVKDNGGK